MNQESNAPMIVGAAAVQQRFDEPAQALDALNLMRRAVEEAARDAGAHSLLAAADMIMLPQGMWSAANPAEVIAPWNAELRSVVADIGVLQQTLVSRACSMVASGAADVVIVCGAEAKFRALRAQITGVTLAEPTTSGAPDERLVPAHEIITREEIERGLPVPARQYAMIDTALRSHEGRSPAEHIDELARLWSGFSDVAAANPDAWNRTPVDTAGMRSAAMLTWPYTKLHCSQWNVDQAAGIIICSAVAADRHGVALDRRVHAYVGIESNLMVPTTMRADLHRSPAVGAIRDAIRVHVGIDAPDIDHLDIYSCFPAAVRVQARELGVAADRQLTVTGGMTFGGGPLNNYTLQSLAKMVHVLRNHPDASGLVTNVSGMLTKVGASVWSCRPPAAPFAAVDVTAAATSATATTDVDPDHTGPATVLTYTVAVDHAVPTIGVVLADTTSGRRALAMTTDPALMNDMLAADWCGRAVEVAGPALRA